MRIIESVDATDKWVRLVALDDTGIRLGNAVTYLPEDFPGVATLDSIQSDFPSRGIGTALLLAAEVWARAHGAEAVIGDLDYDANDRLRSWYSNRGYTVNRYSIEKRIK